MIVRLCEAQASLPLAAELRGDAVERRAGASTDRGDRGQADHDDQRQHHSVLDSGGTILRHEETTNFRSKHVHDITPTFLRRFPAFFAESPGRHNGDNPSPQYRCRTRQVLFDKRDRAHSTAFVASTSSLTLSPVRCHQTVCQAWDDIRSALHPGLSAGLPV